MYPKYKYGVEGDTPAFLYLLPIGLNDPNVPTQGGWGGFSNWGTSEDGVTTCYTNHAGESFSKCNELEKHFYRATFNNFAARMDWAKDGVGNRNPIVVIGADKSCNILTQKSKPGSTVPLDASNSFDPDGDRLTFQWWVISVAGTYSKDVLIAKSDTSVASITLPTDSAGTTIHVICEVTDSGTPQLTGYRRIIFEPTE